MSSAALDTALEREAHQQHAHFATAPISARWMRGFMSFRSGWMPFSGEFGLLLEGAEPDGLFPTQEAAQQAGERFRAKMMEGQE